MSRRHNAATRPQILGAVASLALSTFLILGPALVAAHADEPTTPTVSMTQAPDSPPGQGECDHGNSGKDCRPDPQPDHGKDCEEHGNAGGVNEDHCSGEPSDSPTPDPSESPEPSDTPDPEPQTVTICHATGSESNPYVEVTVDASGLKGHDGHPDDIIPTPEGGCPGPSDSPTTPPPTPIDACPNLEGTQDEVPEGYELDGRGDCVSSESPSDPPSVDLCPNLEGDQAAVPEGYELDGRGGCVRTESPSTPPPPSSSTPPPSHTDDPTPPPPSSSTPAPPVAGETITPPSASHHDPVVAPNTITPPQALAFTGSSAPTLRLGVLAMALLVAGTGLMFAAHRVHRRSET